MSLETLLEAAEFLEWNKAGKKTGSRATRTSKKAEKFKPYVITERKRKSQYAKSPTKPSTSTNLNATVTVVQTGEGKYRSSAITTADDALEFTEAEAEEIERMRADEEQQITLREIRKSIGNRETHNKLEKNRRAHLKECFEELRNELPLGDERRASNLGTLRSALRLIEHLAMQQKDLETEKRRIQRVRNARQAHLNTLRKELSDRGIEYNLEDWIEQHDTSTNSTSTAPECGEAMIDNLQNEGSESVDVTDSAPVSIQPAPDVQVFIKAIPKTKPYSTGNVMIEGASSSSPHSLHLIQQAPANTSASHQPIKVQSSGSETSFPVAASQQQVHSTAVQGVTVSKITQTNIGPRSKIMLAPKVVTTPAEQPQAVGTMGQMLITSPTSLPTTSGNIFITTAPAQAQPVTMAATAGNIPVTSGALTVNLQTGKVFNHHPTPQLLYNRVHAEHSNLNIAPKQLVLIAAPGQQQKLRVINASSTQLNAIAPAVGPGSVTLAAATQQASTTNLFPLNSFTNIPAIQQPATMKPTFITGVIPTTGADGTVSYLPIQFATRPALTMNTTLSSDTTLTNSTSLPTAFLSNAAGGGLTFVIPSVSNQSNPPGVQLVTNHQPQTATIQLSSAVPSSSTTL